MKVAPRVLYAAFAFFGACSLGFSQPDQQSAQVLAKDFPKLWSQFGKRAEEQKADYVVAVDVSGTMKKFRDVVVPNVSAFVDALPDGDYVSVIAFGNDGRVVGIPAVVNASTRSAIRQALASLNFNDQNTDLEAMASKVLDELNRPGGNDLKFVFAFTDFDHDPTAARRGRENWAGLADRFKREQADRNIDFYAMKLEMSAKSGRDLASVERVFPGLQMVPVDPATLGGWFQRKKAEILRDRLRHIVWEAAKGRLPQLSAEADGTNVNVRLDAGDNALIAGITVTGASAAAAPASPPLAIAALPITLEKGGASTSVLASLSSGPYFAEPAPAPAGFSVETEWVLRADAAEVLRLGCELPASPNHLGVSGQLAPPGKLQIRADGSAIEARFESTAKGFSARIDEVTFPSLANPGQPVPMPVVVGEEWTPLVKIPVTGLVSRTLKVGDAAGRAAFVTEAQPRSDSAPFGVPVTGGLVSGRFALWQLVAAAALLAAVILYVLFAYRPGKKIMGKLAVSPPSPACEVPLARFSSITLKKGAGDRQFASAVSSMPEALGLRLWVAGHLASPVRGRRIVQLQSGTAELCYKPGRKEKKVQLRSGMSEALPNGLRDFEIRSNGWVAKWSRSSGGSRF